VDGFLALRPEAHAIVLAVHSWSHEPFRRLRDFVDIGVVASEADRRAALELASRWGVERLWRSTIAVVDWLFDDRTVPWSLRLWAQNLERARERTVFEMHAERWVSDFWAFGTTRALGRLPRRLLDDVRPAEQETWGEKLGRTSLAVRNAARRRSTHDEQLDRRRAQR
jgi:hypothetical protein